MRILAGGVAILPLQDDVGVGGVLRLVDGEDDDRAVVADDVAGVAMAARAQSSVSVKTLKTLPLNESLEEMSLALRDLGVFAVEAALDFGLAMGLAADAWGGASGLL